MKTLKDITTSLELSKRLAKYWKGDGLFKWEDYGEKSTTYPILMHWDSRAVRTTSHGITLVPKYYPARTSEEILEKLPEHFFCIKHHLKWRVGEDCGENGVEYLDIIEDTPQEALGKMLLYLYENELIK